MKYRNGRIEARLWECLVVISIIILTSIQILSSFQLLVPMPVSTTTTNSHAFLPELPPYQTGISSLACNQTSSSSSSSISSSTSNHNHKINDWFDKDWWIQNPVTNSCFFVENICHAGHEWFYDTTSTTNHSIANSGRMEHSSPSPPHQPRLSLRLRWNPSKELVDILTVASGYPSTLHVHASPPQRGSSSSSSSSNQHYHPLHCHYSPIVNHLTLHSYSDSMLGEFYVRLLMGFWDIVQAIYSRPLPQHDQPPNARTQFNQHDQRQVFLEQTQLYLHFFEAPADILESHKLFLNIMYGANPLLPFTALLDTTNCRCMKRLLLCGYQEVVDKDGKKIDSNYDNHSQNNNSAEAKSLFLQPGRFVGPNNHATNPPPRKFFHAKQEMRTVLRRDIIEVNPLLQESIERHRQTQVAWYGSSASSTSSGSQSLLNTSKHDEWTIVGLAQRTTRRKWLGLTTLQRHCNAKFKSRKLICVIVNIEDEKWSNPIQHVVAHAGLDALIGIHGAQLTEALFMPPGSLVVEFLPWIPSHLGVNWGGWTTWTHRPTPLGILFSETDLNHVGYPLGRASASYYCAQNVTRKCFSQKNNQWDNRDFFISYEELDAVITKLILDDDENGEGVTAAAAAAAVLAPSRRAPRTCDHFNSQAGDDYVLYNIHCVPSKSGKKKRQATTTTSTASPGVFHFYRSEAWSKRKHAAY
jgi:hypothetical protein